MSQIYKCENCGNTMVFNPSSQKLQCPGCETTVDIAHDSSSIIEHTLNAYVANTIKASEKTSHTMDCNGCGARIEVDATSTATTCPYCGSKYVLSQKQEDALLPDGVVPFKYNHKEANKMFHDWISSRFWAPNKLKTLHQKGQLQGIYIPYWTFDANVDTHYTAQGGTDYTETHTDNEGKSHTKVHTRWTRVSGHVGDFIDDELIPASTKVSEDLLASLNSFHTSDLRSYAPEYLSGFNAECYTIELKDALVTAHDHMDDHMRELVRREVLRRYDRVSSIVINPRYQDETYKHVLLPIYSSAYHYGDKLYHLLINGQTGEVQGEYPKSVVKIAIAVILCIILAILLYTFLYS